MGCCSEESDVDVLARLKRAAIEAELRCYKRALDDKLDAERRLRCHARKLADLGVALPKDSK